MMCTWMDELCVVQPFPYGCAHTVTKYITIYVPDITIETSTAQPNLRHLYQCFIIYCHVVTL
jgi:hypothetical protein